MARTQVAEGGTVSNIEGSCEYIADSLQGVVLQLEGLGVVLTTPHRKNVSFCEIIKK